MQVFLPFLSFVKIPVAFTILGKNVDTAVTWKTEINRWKTSNSTLHSTKFKFIPIGSADQCQQRCGANSS